MTIVCPRCHGDGKLPDAVTETHEGVVIVVLRKKCLLCLGEGTIVADRRQVKVEGRRMKAMRVKRNQPTDREANRYDVIERDYIRFEQGKPVSEDVMRKLSAKP